MRTNVRMVAWMVGLIGTLVLPAAASADERFASRAGVSSGDCLKTAPCESAWAINAPARADVADGDGSPPIVCADGAPPANGVGCATPDTTAPETTINTGPKGTIAKDSALLKFSSSEEGSTFRCKLDNAKFKLCTSPRRLRKLADGRHTFKVVAVDAAGNEDETPATLRFRVKTE